MDGLQGYFSGMCKRFYQHYFSRLFQGRTSSPEKALQKQPPEVFYKKKYSWKFYKIHRKTPVPECIKKETLAQVFSREFCEISKNTFLQNTQVVVFQIFPAFSRMLTEYGELLSPYSVRMLENAGKMRTRKTSNTDSFYAVNVALKLY